MPDRLNASLISKALTIINKTVDGDRRHGEHIYLLTDPGLVTDETLLTFFTPRPFDGHDKRCHGGVSFV